MRTGTCAAMTGLAYAKPVTVLERLLLFNESRMWALQSTRHFDRKW